MAEGKVCDHVVNTGDICPTVLELAGLEPFEHGHFQSLVPLLEEPNLDDWEDEAYAEFHGQRYAFTQRILWHDHLKYVMNGYDFDKMYDLSEDPAELHNIAHDPAHIEEKEMLLRRIWSKIHETGDTTMANAHYWSLRFFDLGPVCVVHDWAMSANRDRAPWESMTDCGNRCLPANRQAVICALESHTMRPGSGGER